MNEGMPRWIWDYVHTEFQSSTVNTEQSKAWMRSAKKWFTEFVKDIGGKDLKFGIGHFEFHGFFTSPSGQIWYFSSSDVRWKTFDGMLIRTAGSFTDYTGGHNRFILWDDNFYASMKAMVVK